MIVKKVHNSHHISVSKQLNLRFGTRILDLNLGTTPRTKGVKGLLLPNPRVISNTVHRGGFSPPRSNVFNVALTTFGQFIDHDVISTPTVRGKTV